MKTIRIADLRLVCGHDLKPGMILAEGIVLHVRRSGDITFADMASGDVSWQPVDEPFQVYGRLAPGMVDVIISERATR